jgi:hypothetical protein
MARRKEPKIAHAILDRLIPPRELRREGRVQGHARDRIRHDVLQSVAGLPWERAGRARCGG